MPKWGLTMTEGKVLGWLKQRGRGLSRRRGTARNRDEQDHQRLRGGRSRARLRRIVAAAGATLPIGALLAVVGAGRACPTPRSTPLSPASSRPSRPPRTRRQTPARCRATSRPAASGCAFSNSAAATAIAGRAACTASAPTSTPGCSTSRRSPSSRRAVALDLPGHGGSTKALGDAVDAASFAADRRPALAALGIERVHLVGHSMGGAIALHFAALAARAGGEPDADRRRPSSGPRSTPTSSTASCGPQRRREMQEVLTLLVHDPALVSRAMVEDVLRYKRLDGVAAALGGDRRGVVSRTAGSASTRRACRAA